VTARSDAQTRHERRPALVVELDLDYCQNTYGVSPCTAGRKNSGTAQAGSASTITLAAGASAVNDFYNGMTVRLTGGTGSGQERKITDYVGATKVATISPDWTAPDATSTYDVIDRPNGCYNVFLGDSPCQDPANFVKGVTTVKACSRGMPIPTGERILPHITDSQFTPTEIDPKKGLATRSHSTITLTDAPEADVLDKYAADRAAPAASTWWRRLIARNPNAVGRFARARKGYVVSPWDWNTFQTELYIVEALRGPDSRERVTLVLTDPVKLLDLSVIPPVTEGKLQADVPAVSHSGFALGGGAATIRLAADAEAVDGAYVGQEVHILQNTGAGQRRPIIAYNGEDREATVTPAWSVIPDTTSLTEVSPLTALLTPETGAQYPDPAASGKQEFVRLGKELIRYEFTEVGKGWNFTYAQLEGWTAAGDGTLTGADFYAIAGSSGADPQLRSPAALAIEGKHYRYLIVRLRRTAGSSWSGQAFYSTAGHGFSGSFVKTIAEPAGIDAGFVEAVWDMHDLTAGGTDWQDSVITQLRFDFGAASGVTYEVDCATYSATPTLDRNRLRWPDATYRAQFDTAREDHNEKAVAQIVRAWIDTPAKTVIEDIVNEGGLDDSYMDLAGLAQEDTDWLQGARITVAISNPEGALKLLADLAQDLNLLVWWHPVGQKIKFKVDMPQLGLAIPTVTDDKLKLGQTAPERLDAERITQAALDFDLASATADRSERVNYRTIEIHVDGDAEGPNGYDDVRADIRQSRWLTAPNAVFAASNTARKLSRLRDAPIRIKGALDPRDERQVGDLVDVTTRRVVGAAGNPKTIRCRVVKLADDGGEFRMDLRSTVFARRYAFICPNGYPDYPSATADQRQRAFISNGATMSDGTSAYLIS
jgi:hypothetical protein